ncbi:MAG: glycosyltransferase family 2 protein [Vicinamibacterales bacterium]
MRLPDDVTVVIPVKDEAATISGVVRACLPYAREVVVVVHTPARDETAARAREAGARVVADRGRGKGDAMRLAAAEVTTALTVFIDGDGSHEPCDIPRLVEPLLQGQADHVSASRLMGGSSELHGGFDEFFRLAGAAFITACINRRFGVRLSESQNGFRAIRTAVLRQLDLRSVSTTIEQEMIARSVAMGYRMAEVASHEHPRAAGTSHIRTWRVAPRYLWSLARLMTLRRAPLARPAAAGRAVRQPAPHEPR